MVALLTSIGVASLLGSVHCAGMCGGFSGWVAAAARPRGARWGAQAGYHAGRLSTYAAMGLVAGFVGGAVNVGGAWVGLSHAAAVGAGVLMLVWGVARLVGARVPFAIPVPSRIRGAITATLRTLGDAPPSLRGFAIGLLTTWLPCGWLYAFVLAAAGTGDPLSGLAVMGAFWLGTVPILLGVGIGVGALSTPLRRHLPRVTAAALVVVGLALIAGRMPAVAMPSEPRSLERNVEHVVVPDPDAPCPCGHADAR